MTREELHTLREKINNLFYYLFDKLDKDQRESMILTLAEIDNKIEKLNDW